MEAVATNVTRSPSDLASRKRRWRWLAIGAGIVGIVAVLAWYFVFQATRYVPAYYTAALAVDPADAKVASDQCLQRAAELSNDVRLADRWEAQFTAEEINGWLAVDLAGNFPDTLPPEVSDPRIVLEAGEATIAFGYDDGRLHTVVSARLDVYVSGADRLAIRIRSVRAGRLPLPISRLVESINLAAANWDLPLAWQQADGDPVALIKLPSAAGRRAVRLETVEIGEGSIFLSGGTDREP